jgi:hypothetical protein
MLWPTVNLSWNEAPMWGLRPDLYYCMTVLGLLVWGALSNERTDLLFSRVTAVISLLSICIIYVLYAIKCVYNTVKPRFIVLKKNDGCGKMIDVGPI